MAKFTNYLFACDFDRTVTDRTGQIPQANLDAIRYFMEEGGKFTINTGRSLPMSRSRLRDVPMNAPLLACNGAVCYDLPTEALLFCHPMPEDCVPLMRYYEEAYPELRLEVHCLDRHYVFHGDPERDQYLLRQQADFVWADWSMVPDPKVKFAIYTQRKDLFSNTPESEEGQFFAFLEGDINQRGGGRYTAINSMPGMVEVQAAETSKGKAARELANQLGRPILICAGDAPNDLSMLEEADLAFIPADCDERMLGRGFHEADSCREGTVASVIRWLEERN